MLRIAFAGTFSARLEEPVRARLDMPCEVVVADEAGIVAKLPDIDVLITLAFTREMGAAARRLRLGIASVRGADGLDDVLARSDYLALTLPLTSEPRGLLGESRLRSMKPTAILVNVSRAQIVDEDALYRALAERRIAGAALDVWYRYPTDAGPRLPANQPFHELPNVLMTPHVSGWTDGMLEARATVSAENIRRTARGELPLNLVAA